jgi:preprotein translocase subunit SecG
MFTAIAILAIIASILLIFIVLIQNPKGGGIASNFSSGNQIMGVKRTNDFVEKATWTLAIAILILSVGSNFFTGTSEIKESIMKENIENANAPVAPLTQPQQNPGPGNAAPSSPNEESGSQDAPLQPAP